MYIIHFFYRILTKPQAYLLLLIQQLKVNTTNPLDKAD